MAFVQCRALYISIYTIIYKHAAACLRFSLFSKVFLFFIFFFFTRLRLLFLPLIPLVPARAAAAGARLLFARLLSGNFRRLLDTASGIETSKKEEKEEEEARGIEKRSSAD